MSSSNIPEGIYEQIVNTKIKSELSKLDSTKYDIHLDTLEADDAMRILTIYISYVIQQGLHYIRDKYSSTEDVESLVAQIKLCNDIIEEVAKHTGEDDFRGNQILEKGEILTSLYNKLNSARGIASKATQKVVRPITSIVENSLFTGSKNEPSMLSELKKEILTSDQVDLLVSFIKWSVIRPLLPELKEFTDRPNAKLRVIATTYTQATDYKAIMELAQLPNTLKFRSKTGANPVSIRVCAFPSVWRNSYHFGLKLYLFRNNFRCAWFWINRSVSSRHVGFVVDILSEAKWAVDSMDKSLFRCGQTAGIIAAISLSITCPQLHEQGTYPPCPQPRRLRRLTLIDSSLFIFF